MTPLTAAEVELLTSARRAVLATTTSAGRSRLVPLAFAADRRSPTELVIYSALDEKPKSVADPHSLRRVRDIAVRPHVILLVDRWSEDWSELAWLRLEGTATILEPTDDPHGEHAAALRLLRERYPQYKTQKLEMRPAIRIAVERAVSWAASPIP